MRIISERKGVEILNADFQGIEQEYNNLHVYLSRGFTMDIGVNEWKRLIELYEGRYHPDDAR